MSRKKNNNSSSAQRRSRAKPKVPQSSTNETQTPRRRKRPLEERIAIHSTWAKVVNTAVLTTGVVIGIWLVCNVILELSKESFWSSALKLLATIVTALIAPSIVLYRVYISLRISTTNPSNADQVREKDTVSKATEQTETDSMKVEIDQ